MPSVIASILSLIHDWPTQDAATDLDCFCLIIMSKETDSRRNMQKCVMVPLQTYRLNIRHWRLWFNKRLHRGNIEEQRPENIRHWRI